jgi:hypothetical protein
LKCGKKGDYLRTMPISKRIFLIAFVALFSLQGGLAYWLLQHQIWTVKKEMKSLVMAHVSPELITELHLSANDFNSLEWPEPWEFIFKGNMYDVVSTEKNSDGSYTVKAVSDKQENHLKTLVKELVNHSSKSNSQSNQFNFITKTIAWFICNHIEYFDCPIQFPHYTQFRTFNFHLPASAELRVRELPPSRY